MASLVLVMIHSWRIIWNIEHYQFWNLVILHIMPRCVITKPGRPPYVFTVITSRPCLQHNQADPTWKLGNMFSYEIGLKTQFEKLVFRLTKTFGKFI